MRTMDERVKLALDAYEMGLDDGRIHGSQAAMEEGILPPGPDALAAYWRGYNHGVALYCQALPEFED